MTEAEIAVKKAVGHLQSARDLLKAAGALKALDRVRAALQAAGSPARVARCKGNRSTQLR